MGSDQKQLSACLARYMDTKAFTAKKIGKEQAERMKVRREIATKRARAAIRFFEKPENFARLSVRVEPGCPECGFNTCLCDGSPNNPDDAPRQCERCNGEGTIDVVDRPYPTDVSPSTHAVACPECSE